MTEQYFPRVGDTITFKHRKETITGKIRQVTEKEYWIVDEFMVKGSRKCRNICCPFGKETLVKKAEY